MVGTTLTEYLCFWLALPVRFPHPHTSFSAILRDELKGGLFLLDSRPTGKCWLRAAHVEGQGHDAGFDSGDLHVSSSISSGACILSRAASMELSYASIGISSIASGLILHKTDLCP
jgi:hypothetical protein